LIGKFSMIAATASSIVVDGILTALSVICADPILSQAESLSKKG